MMPGEEGDPAGRAIHVLAPPGGHETAQAMFAALVARDACVVRQVAASELEHRIRRIAAAEADAVIVLDEQYADVLGVPPWLRELPALCETRLLLPRQPRTGASAAARAWYAAVDGLITLPERRELPADADVHVVPESASADEALLEACRKPPLRFPQIHLKATCELPTRAGLFNVNVYRVDREEDALLLHMGDLSITPLLVRIHSECFTGEVLASLKCDCEGQLRAALHEISRRGCGAIVYLRQEGRGIGLANKIRAYAEQAKGADTVEANRILGFPADLRDFSVAASILRENGVSNVELHTNNPRKVRALRSHGIKVARVLPSALEPNAHNLDYLRAKYEALGHLGLRDSLPAARVPRARSPAETLLVLDLDGVIQFADRVPEEAVALVGKLRDRGYALRFLTNDGFNSRASRSEQLRRAGLDVGRDELYTASYLAARYVAGRGPILPLAGGPGIDEFARIPQSRTDPAVVVVCDWFREYDAGLLQSAFEAVERGAELVAIHRKPYWQNNGRRLIDVGLWVAGLEYCTRRSATLVGKPSAFAYATVLSDAGFAPQDSLMISDEIEPDLEGARRHGLSAVLFDPIRSSSFGGTIVDSYDAILRLLSGEPGACAST